MTDLTPQQIKTRDFLIDFYYDRKITEDKSIKFSDDFLLKAFGYAAKHDLTYADVGCIKAAIVFYGVMRYKGLSKTETLKSMQNNTRIDERLNSIAIRSILEAEKKPAKKSKGFATR